MARKKEKIIHTFQSGEKITFKQILTAVDTLHPQNKLKSCLFHDILIKCLGWAVNVKAESEVQIMTKSVKFT